MNFKDYLDDLINDFELDVINSNANNKILNKQLYEAKQVGNIYHFTNPVSIKSIIKSKELKLGTEKYVSFTRNPNLTNSGYFNSFDNVIRLTFDGDRMSNNIKIYPISDKNYRDESEEGVLKKVSFKYLKQIDIKPNEIYTSDTLTFVSDLCKKNNIKCTFVSRWEVVK